MGLHFYKSYLNGVIHFLDFGGFKNRKIYTTLSLTQMWQFILGKDFIR